MELLEEGEFLRYVNRFHAVCFLGLVQFPPSKICEKNLITLVKMGSLILDLKGF